MMRQRVATCRIRWLTVAEGGRRTPLSGSVYAPTARFVNEPEVFSVVLRSPQSTMVPLADQAEVELNLLAPDRLPEVAARLVPHRKLQVMEGSRTVAECEILSVRMDEVGPPFGNDPF